MRPGQNTVMSCLIRASSWASGIFELTEKRRPCEVSTSTPPGTPFFEMENADDPRPLIEVTVLPPWAAPVRNAANDAAVPPPPMLTTQLAVVPGATHLFEEPGALDQVADLALAWFERFARSGPEPAQGST
jgi:hypothetical protein